MSLREISSWKARRKRIPVTQKYSGALKIYPAQRAFITSFPEHPDDKALRLLGLIDFGWRELFDLDRDAPRSMPSRKNGPFGNSRGERMLTYFRQILVNRIDKRRVIKNIIYQLLRWMKRG